MDLAQRTLKRREDSQSQMCCLQYWSAPEKSFRTEQPRNWEACQGTALAAVILATFATGNALMGRTSWDAAFGMIILSLAVLLLTNPKILVRQSGFLRNGVY